MNRFAVVVLFSAIAAADHLPTDLIARGNPETVLCGIDVYRSTLAQLKERLGRPARFDEYPKTEEAAEAEWHKDGSILHATINADKIAYAVELSGKPSTIGQTGRGLGLGQTLADVKRIYGRRFQQRGKLITLQWANGTEPRVRLDDGKIASLLLIANVE